MNISIKQVKAFVAVAESRSFAEACARIHLSQPALSIAVRNLEETAGGPLLTRTTRTLALTPEGQAFLPVAQRLLNDWDEAFSDLHNLFAKRRGKLSIAAMPSFAASLLPHALAHYRQFYPNINIAVEDVVAERVVEMVQSGRVEIGVSFDPESEPDLDFTPLFRDRFVVMLPPRHPLLSLPKISWQDLKDYPFLALQRPSSIRKLIESTLAASGAAIEVQLEAHQLASIGRMIANGLGISIMPSLCIPQMEVLGLAHRPLLKPALSRQVGILTRKRYPLSAAGQAMVTTLVEQITHSH